MKQKTKGSVTIFMALVMSLVLALLCAQIQAIQVAASRVQVLNAMDIGMYSLFAHYDKDVLEKYDVFLLDAGQGTGKLNLAKLCDIWEEYAEPVLDQSITGLCCRSSGFSGYELITDEHGEAFFSQAVEYMEKRIGINGALRLMDKVKKQSEQSDSACKNWENAREEETMENYDSAIEEAQLYEEEANQNMQEPPEESEVSTEHSYEAVGKNPIDVIRDIKELGILELVLEQPQEVSDLGVTRRELLSERTIRRGLPYYKDNKKSDVNDILKKVLFQEYILEKMGNYRNPGEGALQYQTEYIINGEDKDIENLKGTVNKILVIREGCNLIHLYSSPSKRAQASALAASIATAFLVPPAASLIEFAILLCWAFAESILDLRELMAGGKVAFMKQENTWQLSLENLPFLLERLDTDRRQDDSGLSYEDYLRVLLMMVSEDELKSQSMNMVESTIRKIYNRSGFSLDSCITAAEMILEVFDSQKRTYSTTQQYSYE